MAAYHDDKASSSTLPPTAGSSQLPQPHLGITSPYQYQGPSGYPQDGLSSSQYGNGARPGPGPSSTNTLSAASQSVQHPSSLSNPQHHGNVSPALQYPSSAPISHGSSGSPPGQASTTSDPVSPPNHHPTPSTNGKKNTRIPRACDLCSQRKVKVSRWTRGYPAPTRLW